MTNNKIEDLIDSDFDERVRHSPKPVVIDFWAPWCGPCKEITPILQKMLEKYGGSVEFMKMNVDEEKDTPATYAVRSIPTLLFFKQGTVANQIIGVESEEKIEGAIKGLL